MKRARPISICLSLSWLLAAGPAAADLWTVEIDGVVHITSRRPKGGKIIYHERARTKPGARRRRPAGRRRRAGGMTSRAADFAATVRRAAAHYALPQSLIWAVMRVESGFNPDAVSNKGAQGLLQLMPLTAEDMGVRDPFDPTQNIFGGARYLRLLANRFDGDLVLTLSAYHAGGGAVNSAGGIPYNQTAEYVRRVLNAYYEYQRRPPVPDPQRAAPEAPE